MTDYHAVTLITFLLPLLNQPINKPAEYVLDAPLTLIPNILHLFDVTNFAESPRFATLTYCRFYKFFFIISDNPDDQLKPKKKVFEQVKPDLRVNENGFATYKGACWTLKNTPTAFIKAEKLRGVPIA